jgi:hypothetical protein
MFVSFLFLQGFTTKSHHFKCSQITIHSYTSVPGFTNNGHLSCKFHNEKVIVLPFSPEIIAHTSLFSIAPLYGS